VPKTAKALLDRATALEARANELPHEMKQRWSLVAKAQQLKQQAKDVVELSAAGMRDSHVIGELGAIRAQETDLQALLDAAESTAKPLVKTAWDTRVEKSQNDDHGFKHRKAKTDAEAKTMSTPSSNPSVRLS